MNRFLMNQDFSAEQLIALTRCMLSTAHVDGIHPAETALISQFYAESRSADMPAFETLESQHAGTLEQLPRLGGDAAFTHILVSLCLMTGYADGSLSEAERAHVHALATALGVSAEDAAGLLQDVQDSLLGALSHLPDAQSVASLAKEL